MCLSHQSPNSETPYYCLPASLLFTEATRGIKPGSKHTPCQTIGPENNTLPRQIVTHMINFWEYEKPRLLWTLKKLVGHRYLVSGIYGSRFIYICLYRIPLGLDWIAWRRRCCNLELNWGAFHWDVPCYNERAELTQKPFFGVYIQVRYFNNEIWAL